MRRTQRRAVAQPPLFVGLTIVAILLAAALVGAQIEPAPLVATSSAPDALDSFVLLLFALEVGASALGETVDNRTQAHKQRRTALPPPFFFFLYQHRTPTIPVTAAGLLVVFYVFTVVGEMLSARNDPMNFATAHLSIATLFGS